MSTHGSAFDQDGFLGLAREAGERLRGARRRVSGLGPAVVGLGAVSAAYYQVEPEGHDPELYRVLRGMDTYHAGVDKDGWLVLSTDAELFHDLQSPRAGAAPRRSAPAPRK